MPPRIVGEHPLAKDGVGKLKSRIGTLFPQQNVLVTLRGIHATQRLAYLDLLNQQRARVGQPPLGREEQTNLWLESVDLIMENDTVLIRPDPDNMQLAFQADGVLQEIVPKHKIKFLNVLNEKVHSALKHRGECWRIAALPKSRPEMVAQIQSSRIGIGGREIYYYNSVAGTRLLTCEEFAGLRALDDAELRQHLLEIREFAVRTNRLGSGEVRFFQTDPSFSPSDLAAFDFATMGPQQLRSAHEELARKFEIAVAPEYRHDDPTDTLWRSRMYAALFGQEDAAVSEESLLGLSSEFFMQIQWLPGGRIVEGELIFDPIFEAKPEPGTDAELERLCDEKSRGMIFNFVREYGDLEYVNIGRVIGSSSRRKAFYGRRDVYIAVVKLRGSDKELVNIIRMQKWGIREHLEKGKNLLDAILEAEEYTEYILDRRLGCRQLGMNLPSRVTARRLSECYHGRRTDHHGATIWSLYFQRDYIRGVASDKVPHYRFADEAFALAFARLLGEAAAPNMIVGRCDLGGNVLFDDGDEVLVENSRGIPVKIVVADQTGTFADYLRDLQDVAIEYAAPIDRRLDYVAHPEAFADTYLDAFAERFLAIQREYRKRRRAFDTLFKHRRRDVGGSVAYRWEQLLARLDRTDPRELKDLIREKLTLKCEVF